MSMVAVHTKHVSQSSVSTQKATLKETCGWKKYANVEVTERSECECDLNP